MKLPKGFGKNYFTLSAIAATVNLISINATATRTNDFYSFSFDEENSELEIEEDKLSILCPLQLSTKTCYCNCFFLHYTRKSLKLFNSQKHFFNYFKTLNNSTSPPKLFLFSL